MRMNAYFLKEWHACKSRRDDSGLEGLNALARSYHLDVCACALRAAAKGQLRLVLLQDGAQVPPPRRTRSEADADI